MRIKDRHVARGIHALLAMGACVGVQFVAGKAAVLAKIDMPDSIAAVAGVMAGVLAVRLFSEPLFTRYVLWKARRLMTRQWSR
ncbi:hypothetical protein ACT2FY_37980 [Paraburkholderia fungorum]|jgi:hypothetical protein|uniref:hypothetical protein n=1 Tax=Paraburkholderia fungorum TaxID=134537 RepID=UPI00402BA81C